MIFFLGGIFGVADGRILGGIPTMMVGYHGVFWEAPKSCIIRSHWFLGIKINILGSGMANESMNMMILKVDDRPILLGAWLGKISRSSRFTPEV